MSLRYAFSSRSAAVHTPEPNQSLDTTATASGSGLDSGVFIFSGVGLVQVVGGRVSPWMFGTTGERIRSFHAAFGPIEAFAHTSSIAIVAAPEKILVCFQSCQ